MYFAACLNKSIAGASEDWGGKYAAKHLFEHSEKGRWVTSKGGWVVINLGCAKDFNTVELAATTSEGHKDRFAKKIIVSVGDSPRGEWKEVLSKTLADYRKHKGPMPLVTFSLEEMVNSQFVKLECTEWYGQSCAFQYLNVKKSGKSNNSESLMMFR